MSDCKICGPMFIGVCPHKPPSEPRVELLTTNETSSKPVVPEPNQKPPSGPSPQVLYVHVEGFRTKHAATDLASKDFIRKVVSLEDYDSLKAHGDELQTEIEHVTAQRDALLADNETGAKLLFDYWQSTLKERDALKFELQSKQRPLSEQVLALTIEKEALAAEVERLKAQDLTHAVIASDIKLREERDALRSACEMLSDEMKFAMKYYKDCGDEAEPEFQLYKSFEKALANYEALKRQLAGEK